MDPPQCFGAAVSGQDDGTNMATSSATTALSQQHQQHHKHHEGSGDAKKKKSNKGKKKINPYDFPISPLGLPMQPNPIYLPHDNVYKVMKSVIPSKSVKISLDAKECMVQCATEFIAFVSSEASEQCSSACRKRLTPVDILSALEALGLESYIQSVLET
ncbi:nuclear transcription Y subunit beta [Pelomyxa schiedti]|nr:nuclear transcription Y subunit beta [Pelomyxa schiedti]